MTETPGRSRYRTLDAPSLVAMLAGLTHAGIACPARGHV